MLSILLQMRGIISSGSSIIVMFVSAIASRNETNRLLLKWSPIHPITSIDDQWEEHNRSIGPQSCLVRTPSVVGNGHIDVIECCGLHLVSILLKFIDDKYLLFEKSDRESRLNREKNLWVVAILIPSHKTCNQLYFHSIISPSSSSLNINNSKTRKQTREFLA